MGGRHVDSENAELARKTKRRAGWQTKRRAGWQTKRPAGWQTKRRAGWQNKHATNPFKNRPAGFGKFGRRHSENNFRTVGRKISDGLKFFGEKSNESEMKEACPPKKKNLCIAQMKDQVMTINSVQKSSKSELSSGTFGHFKVLKFCSGGWLAVSWVN